MPTITALEIQKKNKQRVNVYVDGEFLCGMEIVSALSAGLKVGKEVSPESLEAAIFDSEVSAAFGKAADYLSRAMKTSRQMRDYLTQKGFAPKVVEETLAKLKGYRYIDDDVYARLYIEQNSASKGARRLKNELLQKGLSLVKAEEYSQTFADCDYGNAKRLAEKYMRGKQRDLKSLSGLQRYLLSRGYGYDVVNSLISEYRSDED
ncbi:MAG: RecX family transcriptional regulator [Corallococcus sp.]|nr:RecX family transcriptional regulator [Corallococcus sp.]